MDFANVVMSPETPVLSENTMVSYRSVGSSRVMLPTVVARPPSLMLPLMNAETYPLDGRSDA